jgi:hypothetical protein
VKQRSVSQSVSLSIAKSEWYTASELGKELLYLRILSTVAFCTCMRNRAQLSRWRIRVTETGRDTVTLIRVSNVVDQLVKDHIVNLVHFRTNRVADSLTKNLPAPAFEQHRATMLGEGVAPFSAMCRI